MYTSVQPPGIVDLVNYVSLVYTLMAQHGTTWRSADFENSHHYMASYVLDVNVDGINSNDG